MMPLEVRSPRSVRFGLLGASMIVVPWALVTDAIPENEWRRQQSAFVSVVGNWTSVDDGGPAFKIDGESWDGTTVPREVESAGKQIFRALTSSFIANGTATGAFPLAVWNQVLDFKQGTIRVQFKMVAGRSDQNAGIVIGLQPTGEYVFVRYNTKDGNVAVWAYADGQRRVLQHGSAHAQLALGDWHELTVTVAGAKVTGSVNGGALTVEHTLDKPVTGRVGLWTKRDAVTVFKGYRVTQ